MDKGKSVKHSLSPFFHVNYPRVQREQEDLVMVFVGFFVFQGPLQTDEDK